MGYGTQRVTKPFPHVALPRTELVMRALEEKAEFSIPILITALINSGLGIIPFRGKRLDGKWDTNRPSEAKN